MSRCTWRLSCRKAGKARLLAGTANHRQCRISRNLMCETIANFLRPIEVWLTATQARLELKNDRDGNERSSKIHDRVELARTLVWRRVAKRSRRLFGCT